MGCDIHMCLEGRNDAADNWVSADYFRINPYYRPERDDEPRYWRVGIYSSRNYELFAILADVRNYDNRIIPIDNPRGIPDDSCDVITDEYASWGIDAHSASYLTLKELKEYAASAPVITYGGMLSPEQAAVFDSTGELPTSWCGWCSDKSYVYREWQEENRLLDPIIEAIEHRAAEIFWWFGNDAIEKHLDDLRIVFWFDN